MTLRYTTVQEFWKKYGLNNSVMDFQPGQTPERESVASSPVTAGNYYLTHMGVNEDTLKLYAGSTQLTITTHYTFDSDTSKVSVTSAGAIALSGEDLTAEYEYNELGKYLNYNESVAILESAEREFERDSHQRFSDTTDIQYRQVSDEVFMFTNEKLRLKKGLNTAYNPVYTIETTVNGAYTTGGSEITLADASLFPTTGTIYIGGNKVSYSGKSSNVLTIPSSTPSISDGAVVYSTILEVSLESEGNVPVWKVLVPKKDYEVDDDTGYIKVLNTAFFNEVTVSQINIYPDNVQLRASYFNVWHEKGAEPFIPEDVVEAIYQIGARNLRRNTVFKSHIGQRDNFTPTTSTESKEYISDTKDEYSVQYIEIR
jgi:hypothetical protein